MQAIDVWAQPAPPGAFSSPIFGPLVLRAKAQERVTNASSPHKIVEEMDEAGITKALLSAWRLTDGWMISNSEIAKFVSQFPNRFVGVASASPDDASAPEELEWLVTKCDFKALRVLPWIWNRPPNHLSYRSLFLKCIELEIPYCTQVGHTGPRMPSDPGRPIPYIDELALAFPNLKIIGGHIGYPWTDEMIALSWKYDNVYIDTSAYLPKYYPQQLINFMNTYGHEKVLFGTNYPMLSLKDCLSQALELKISDHAKERFLYRNAQRVFNLT